LIATPSFFALQFPATGLALHFVPDFWSSMLSRKLASSTCSKSPAEISARSGVASVV